MPLFRSFDARRGRCLESAVAALALSAASLGAQDAADASTTVGYRAYVGADYSYASFFGDIDPWQLAALSVAGRSRHGTLILRGNFADRFGATGTQLEVDAYPRLGAGRYAYLNAGGSGAGVFPDWRAGAEVFTSLPRSWEASLGFRHLRFDGDPVTLFTGSVGRYVGNCWFSVRPYVRSKDEGLSASASLSARRYYEDADRFVGLRVGYGSTPTDQLNPAELARTSSFSAAVQGSHGLGRRALGTWSAGFDRERLPLGATRESATAQAGLRLLFF